VKIPQLDSTSQSIPIAATASYLPTYSTGDILWAFVDLPGGPASYFPSLPDLVLPDLNKLTNTKVRDLPYSYDFLVENFMDPAHIPFAHHKLQGTRKDAVPIPSEVTTSEENTTHCEILFSDQMRGKPRKSTVLFVAPCYFTLNILTTSVKLIILCVPVAPGKSRVFVDTAGFPSSGPKWFSHAFTNRFLDSDIWLHDQERLIRNPRNKFYDIPGKLTYCLPTVSDTGPRAFRKWWQKHLAGSPVFGDVKGYVPEYSAAEQVDWKLAHIRVCTPCQVVIRRANLARKITPYLAALLAVVLPTRTSKALGVIAAWLMSMAAERVKHFVQGPEPGELTSPAQKFPE